MRCRQNSARLPDGRDVDDVDRAPMAAPVGHQENETRRLPADGMRRPDAARGLVEPASTVVEGGSIQARRMGPVHGPPGPRALRGQDSRRHRHGAHTRAAISVCCTHPTTRPRRETLHCHSAIWRPVPGSRTGVSTSGGCAIRRTIACSGLSPFRG